MTHRAELHGGPHGFHDQSRRGGLQFSCGCNWRSYRPDSSDVTSGHRRLRSRKSYVTELVAPGVVNTMDRCRSVWSATCVRRTACRRYDPPIPGRPAGSASQARRYDGGRGRRPRWWTCASCGARPATLTGFTPAGRPLSAREPAGERGYRSARAAACTTPSRSRPAGTIPADAHALRRCTASSSPRSESVHIVAMTGKAKPGAAT